MTSSRFSVALAGMLLSSLAVPTVNAYITPEEMLTGTANQTSLVDPADEEFDEKDWTIEGEEPEEDLPSGIRYTLAGTQYRIQESDNQHTTLKRYASASSEEHLAAPVTEEDSEAMEPEEDVEVGGIDLDWRTVRLLERLTRRENAKAFSPTAHAGAPLAPTGSATVIAMVAMVAAIGWTVRRAKRKSVYSFTR